MNNKEAAVLPYIVGGSLAAAAALAAYYSTKKGLRSAQQAAPERANTLAKWLAKNSGTVGPILIGGSLISLAGYYAYDRYRARKEQEQRESEEAARLGVKPPELPSITPEKKDGTTWPTKTQ